MGPRWAGITSFRSSCRGSFATRSSRCRGTGASAERSATSDDAVAPTLVALDAADAADGIFNIGNPLEEHSVDDLVAALARVTGRAITPRYVPFPHAGTDRRVPDVSRAEQILALRPRVTLEEGLRATYEWYATRISDTDRLASGS